MFQKPKQPPFAIPVGSKVTFAVKYPGGRKPFDTHQEAMAFAKVQRDSEKGWAEVVRVIETVVSPR